MKQKNKKKKLSTDVADVTVPAVLDKVSTKNSNLKKKKKVIVKQAEPVPRQDANKNAYAAANGTYPEPGQPAIESLIGTEIGDSGVRNIGGIIQEDYNPAMNGLQGIKIYDEMRRSDGTVRAILLACTLPIRQAKWRVEAATKDDEQAAEVAEFVRRNLFDMMKTPWSDFIRQALQCLTFGVMPFEKVYAPQDFDGKTMIVLQDLKQRLPKSIYRWMLADGTLGIQQQRQDGVLAEIPMSKMVVFVNEKEGDNWWGMSVLRSAYKHWYIKNTVYKIDAIGIERQAVGVPYVKLPQGATDSDKRQAQTILQNLRANESAYIIEPFTYEIGFKDMMAHSVRDVEPTINHHNREITKSVLAQFLELGSQQKGGSGGASRALSQDHSKLFLQGLEAICEMIKDAMNKYLIPQLVDLNFDVEEYPTLDYTGVSDIDVASIASALKTLTDGGYIKPIDNDEMYFRDLMDMPELTEEEIAERELQEQQNIDRGLNPDGTPIAVPFDTADDDTVTTKDNKKNPKIKKPSKSVDAGGADVKETDLASSANMSEMEQEFKKKRKFDAIAMKSRVETQLAKMNTSHKLMFLNKNLRALDRMNLNPFMSELKAILTEKQADLHALIFKENNDFKGWRELTFTEKKVDLYGMNEMIDKLETQFQSTATEYLGSIKDEYVRNLSRLLHDNDLAGIAALDLQVQQEYKDLVKNTLRAAFTYGKNNASREMGVNTPTDPVEIANIIDITASNIAETHFNEMASEAKTVVTEQLAKKLSAAQIAAMVDDNLDETIDYIVNNTGRIIVGASINQGRGAVFGANLDNIYAYQRSEILDLRTCAYCLSLDGRIVSKDDPFAQNTIFHSSCRGIWVEILMDETEKPDITGIPNSLKDSFGGAINDLKQPKKPIVKKDSLAAKFLNGQ